MRSLASIPSVPLIMDRESWPVLLPRVGSWVEAANADISSSLEAPVATDVASSQPGMGQG